MIAQDRGVTGRVARGAVSGMQQGFVALRGPLALAILVLAGAMLLWFRDLPQRVVHACAPLSSATATRGSRVYLAEIARRAVPGAASRAAEGATAIGFASFALALKAFARVVAAAGR